LGLAKASSKKSDARTVTFSSHECDKRANTSCANLPSQFLRTLIKICSCNQTAMNGRSSIRQPDNSATGAKEALLFLSLRLKYAFETS